MGSNDLLPYALLPTSRKPAFRDLRYTGSVRGPAPGSSWGDAPGGTLDGTPGVRAVAGSGSKPGTPPWSHAAGEADGSGGVPGGSGSVEAGGSGSFGPEDSGGSGSCGTTGPGFEGGGGAGAPRGGSPAPPAPVAVPVSAPGGTPGAAGEAAALPGSGECVPSRSECAWAPPTARTRPAPATVPPSGRAALPPCPAEGDGDGEGDGEGSAPPSPTLMQPVDAATVTATTAAQRAGTGSWRTESTSGVRTEQGSGREGGRAPCPTPATPPETRPTRNRPRSRRMGRVLEMTREAFEELVADALDTIPPELTRIMDNVAVFVEDEPPADDPELLGLYEGTPLTERGEWYAGVLPDRISIYKGPTLRMCETPDEVVHEVAVTVVHEIAHHFGIDDERLHELGWG